LEISEALFAFIGVVGYDGSGLLEEPKECAEYPKAIIQ